jgi:hypothetical protein
MINFEKIANQIRENLGSQSTHYFIVQDSNGNNVKIRVGNHSANRQNNLEKTLSFITERTEQKKSGYNQMVNEWVVLEEGYTDTYETLEDILENELN